MNANVLMQMLEELENVKTEAEENGYADLVKEIEILQNREVTTELINNLEDNKNKFTEELISLESKDQFEETEEEQNRQFLEDIFERFEDEFRHTIFYKNEEAMKYAWEVFLEDLYDEGAITDFEFKVLLNTKHPWKDNPTLIK